MSNRLKDVCDFYLSDCCGVSDNRKDIIITDQNKIIKGNRRNPNKEDNTSLRSNNNDEEDKKQKELDISDVLNCFFALNAKTGDRVAVGNVFASIVYILNEFAVPYKTDNSKAIQIVDEQSIVHSFQEVLFPRKSQYVGRELELEKLQDHNNLNIENIKIIRDKWQELGEQISVLQKNIIFGRFQNGYHSSEFNSNIETEKVKHAYEIFFPSYEIKSDVSVVSLVNDMVELHNEYSEKLNKIIDSITKCSDRAKDVLMHNKANEKKKDSENVVLKCKDITNFLLNECLSGEEIIDKLMDILKNGYILNGKRKFLNLYELSALMKPLKGIRKRILGDNLTIMYNSILPYQAILIDPKTLESNSDKDNNSIIDDFISQSISNERQENCDIEISNYSGCSGWLESCCIFNDLFETGHNFLNQMFYTPIAQRKPNIVIIHNNTNNTNQLVPVSQFLSEQHANNAMEFLKNVTHCCHCQSYKDINILFDSNSIGTTNMIYQLEKLADLKMRKDKNIFIPEICFNNIPIDFSFITFKHKEMVERSINALCELIKQGYITEDRRCKIVLTAPDNQIWHKIKYSDIFLKYMLEKFQNTNIVVNNKEKKLNDFIGLYIRERRLNDYYERRVDRGDFNIKDLNYNGNEEKNYKILINTAATFHNQKPAEGENKEKYRI